MQDQYRYCETYARFRIQTVSPGGREMTLLRRRRGQWPVATVLPYGRFPFRRFFKARVRYGAAGADAAAWWYDLYLP